MSGKIQAKVLLDYAKYKHLLGEGHQERSVSPTEDVSPPAEEGPNSSHSDRQEEQELEKTQKQLLENELQMQEIAQLNMKSQDASPNVPANRQKIAKSHILGTNLVSRKPTTVKRKAAGKKPDNNWYFLGRK
jgi:hypothetical protein